MVQSAKLSFLALLAMLPLAGCGASDEGSGVGGVTSGEANALNEAAAMLDKRADNARSALDTDEKDAAR